MELGEDMSGRLIWAGQACPLTRDGVEELAALFGPQPSPWQAQLLARLRDWFDPHVSSFTFPTSGSTGPPSSCVHPRARLVASADRTLASPLLRRPSPPSPPSRPFRALLAMPTLFVGGWMMVVRAWRAGWDLTLVEPRALPEWPDNEPPFDFVALTPMQALSLGPRLAAFRRVLLGGAATPPGLPWPDEVEIWSSFGMTETASHVALRRIHPDPEPAFTCLPGVTWSTGDSGALVLEDTVLGLPPLTTRDAVVPGPGPTTFQWLGRLDDVINTGGLKVHPAEVETCIAPILDAPFVVFGLPHAKLGTQVAIRIDAPLPDLPAQRALMDRARAALEGCLPAAALPRHWEWAPLERTDSGKWKRPK